MTQRKEPRGPDAPPPPEDELDPIERMKRGVERKVNADLAAGKEALRRRLKGPGNGGGY
jgi:hypothetical protein